MATPLKNKEISYAREFFDLKEIKYSDPKSMAKNVQRRADFINAADDDVRREIIKDHIREVTLPKWEQDQRNLKLKKDLIDTLVTKARNYLN